MKNIFAEGLDLTRDDNSVIHLTPAELNTISHYFNAFEGLCSVEFYIDKKNSDLKYCELLDDDEIEQTKADIAIAEKMLEDIDTLATIYEEIEYDVFQETGEIELDNVQYAINTYEK